MTEETMVMNTVKVNWIRGTVHGISKEAFDTLAEEMRRCFRNVEWDNDRLYIDNRKSDPFLGTFDEIERLLEQVAEAVPEGKYGKLGFIGLMGKREVVAVIFLKRKHWEMREFERPELPEWYKSEEWYRKERWEEEIMWDEMFRR